MTITEVEEFYNQDQRKYEVVHNRKLLNWLKKKIKNGYDSFVEIECLQELIDSIVSWYEIKYPEREMEFYEGITHTDFEKMETFCESLTKLSTKDILSSPDFMTIWNDFLSWLQNYSCIEICTWSKSDKKFLARTLKEYESQIPYKLEFKDIQPIISANVMGKQTIGLGKVKEFYGYENIIQHNALEDAKDTNAE